MEELISALIAGAVTLIGAVVTFVVSYLKNKAVKQENDAIKTQLANIEKTLESADGKFFIICPKCGSKIYLASVDIKKEV